MTKLDIFNIALSQHGKRCTESELKSENPPTEVEACKRMYRIAIEDTLSEYDWSFCLAPIEIDTDDDEPYGKWIHGYALPGNIVRIARPYSHANEPFMIAKGRYYTNEENPQPWGILLSATIMDIAPPDFCQLVGTWLGYLVSTIISPSDSNLAQRILQNYSAHLTALLKKEQNSIRDSYLEPDDWSVKS